MPSRFKLLHKICVSILFAGTCFGTFGTIETKNASQNNPGTISFCFHTPCTVGGPLTRRLREGRRKYLTRRVRKGRRRAHTPHAVFGPRCTGGRVLGLRSHAVLAFFPSGLLLRVVSRWVVGVGGLGVWRAVGGGFGGWGWRRWWRF